MLTVLGQYILPGKREAEKTDTHQYIRKHERDQNSKKKNKNRDDDLFDMEDTTSVSVDALYSFLENLIKSSQSDDIIDHSEDIDSKEKINRDILEEAAFITFKRQKNTSQNAKAAGAYAHAAETSPEASMRGLKMNNADEQAQLLQGEDKVIIEDFLKDLKILQNHHIRDIEIERAGTFIESLRHSIQQQKSYISNT